MKNKNEQMSMFKQLNTSEYTYKSSELIMSSYELTVTEQRIITLGCKKIKPLYIENKMTPNDLKKLATALEFSNIEISVSEYKKEFNVNTNNIYDSLEKYSNKLYEREIIYYDNEELSRKRWISSCRFNRKKGTIYLTFNTDMILDLLLLNGNYIALKNNILSESVRSKYVYRNYEIFKSYLYLHKWKISIEEYRFLLQINNKYKKFAELKRNVIEPSLKFINLNSDIKVTYTTTKKGKNINWIEFNIQENKNSTTTLHSINNFKDKIPSVFKEISNALEKYNITLTSEEAELLIDKSIEVTRKKYKNKSAVQYILEKIKILDNYILTNKVNNVIGYLIKAIEEDWSMCNIDKNYKNGFNNFEGRNYSDEFFKQLESKLNYI